MPEHSKTRFERQTELSAASPTLVEFDIDTQELREQADKIRQQKQQTAEQFQQYQQGTDQPPQPTGMYQ